MKIVLHIEEIKEYADDDQLTKVEHDLTIEDYEYYNEKGWKNFRPENHIEWHLPSLGEPIYVNDSEQMVIEIKGKRWKIAYDFDYNYDPWDHMGKTISFELTDLPVSKSRGNDRYHSGVQLRGQPRFVQSMYFPAYKGKACHHLMTIESGWGDCGNQNVMVALDDDGIPVAVFMEASCC